MNVSFSFVYGVPDWTTVSAQGKLWNTSDIFQWMKILLVLSTLIKLKHGLGEIRLLCRLLGFVLVDFMATAPHIKICSIKNLIS